MSCDLIPSVTLWGTTQITIQTRYTTTLTPFTIPPSDVLSPGSYMSCDDSNEICITISGASVPLTTTLLSIVETTSVYTSLVPRQTLYSPCLTTGGSTIPSSTRGTATPSSTRISSDNDNGLTASGGAQASSMSVIQSQSQGISNTDSVMQSFVSHSDSLSTSLTISEPTSGTATEHQSITSTYWSHTISNPSASTQNQKPSSYTNALADKPSDNSTHHTHHNQPGIIIGSVIGSVVVIAIVLLVHNSWKKRIKKSKEERAVNGGDNHDYWETRFRALESQGDVPDEKRGESSVRNKRLRVSISIDQRFQILMSFWDSSRLIWPPKHYRIVPLLNSPPSRHSSNLQLNPSVRH